MSDTARETEVEMRAMELLDGRVGEPPETSPTLKTDTSCSSLERL